MTPAGVTSMTAPLRRVLVRRPALAGDWDAAGWRTPDPGRLAIPLRMRKPMRSREPLHMIDELERLGVPVLGTLPEGAYADGGDRFWLDDTTMAIGLSYRTNLAGARAVAELAAPEG